MHGWFDRYPHLGCFNTRKRLPQVFTDLPLPGVDDDMGPNCSVDESHSRKLCLVIPVDMSGRRLKVERIISRLDAKIPTIVIKMTWVIEDLCSAIPSFSGTTKVR